MPMPSEWIDRLFARLAVRYGAAFLAQWPDTDIAIIKADWAEVLDGFDGDSIAYGLRYLSSDKPPTAGKFRDICRLAPVVELRGLPPPPADPERVQRALTAAKVTAAASRISPAQECINGIEARVAAGNRLTPGQRHVVAHCLRMPGTSTTLAVERAA